MSFRLRLHLEELPVYVPGATFPGAIKLASNEVTFGPLPSVEQAITDSLQTINRYPDNGMVELTASLAKRLGVTEDEIQVGCGSVSLCQNLVTITCEPGDEVVHPSPAWPNLLEAARIDGASEREVARNDTPDRSVGQNDARLDGGYAQWEIDTAGWYCVDGLCPPQIGNVYIYRDQNHISNAYSLTLAPLIWHHLGPLLEETAGS